MSERQRQRWGDAPAELLSGPVGGGRGSVERREGGREGSPLGLPGVREGGGRGEPIVGVLRGLPGRRR